MIETIEPPQFVDPSEAPIYKPKPEVVPIEQRYGFTPMTREQEWLFEHQPREMKPYVDYSKSGYPKIMDGLQSRFPGIADKITKAQKAGFTDAQIGLGIEIIVGKYMDAGFSDGQIEKKLFKGYQNYGFWERPLASLFYGRSKNIPEKVWDYVGTTPDYDTDPVKHEIRAVVERGLSSFTGGLSDALQEEIATPETIPGALAASVASAIGFIYGPLKAAKGLIGGKLAPTATGLRGVAQICTQGGATLGLAHLLSDAIPAFTQSESLTEAGVRLVEGTGTMTLTGFLYPLAGAIPTKPLRLAVGMAALDYMRGKGEFEIDDLVKGVRDGTIEPKELSERAFGYLLNLYFLNKVKPMREQLAGLEKNAMVRKMLECNSDEIEAVILQIRDAQLIPGDPERFLNGVGKWDKLVAFGSQAEFYKAYRLMQSEQFALAAKIQADIEGKTTIRIPKDLQNLAAKARTYTKAVNFASAAKGKLRPEEIKALQKIFPAKKPLQPLSKKGIKTIRTSAGTIEIPSNELNVKWDKALEVIFDYGNQTAAGRPIQPGLSRSLSMGDTVEYEGKNWLVMPQGWQDVSQLTQGQIGKLVGPLKIPLPPKRPTTKTTVRTTDLGIDQLKKFWQGVQDRDYLEKQSMIQHRSQTEKLMDALKVERMFNKSDTELQRMNIGKIRKNYQKVARAIWDTSSNVKRDLLKKGGALGREAMIRHDLIKGANAKATRIINDACDKIYSGLTKAEEITLNRIIQSRRTITIDKYKPEMKHPGGLGLKEHQAYLDSITENTFMKLNARADIYFQTMNDQVNQLLKAGIISRESAAGLLSKGDYSPRKFIQHIDPERTYTFGGKKITVWDSGIKALEEGSYKNMENNSRLLLSEVVSRTQARIFRNQANQALYNLAKDMPENGVVRLSEIVKVTKKGKPVFQKTPAGFERLGVMVDGQMRVLLMPSDMAREWVSADPAVSLQWANAVGWVSGAKLLRPMATGLNPEFALTNLPRDIAHAWLVTYEYSPHLPKAVGQLVRDYTAVAKDTFTRQGRWLDYLNEGGGMEFLTHQGRITGKTSGLWSGLQKYLGWAGETSEIWTRLALRERAIRNGKPNHEATWIARNYLDFSQGGSLIKGADSAVPYFNAAVQGTRGIFRAAKEHPATFTYKAAEIGVLSTGIYLANKYGNPECWESVSDYDKANYFIVTTPLSYIDEEGNKRYLYFRVAKDQGQKIICTMFENLMAKSLGEDIDVEQVSQAAKEFIPLSPTERIPPMMDAMIGYLSNKDFWRNEDIWKGPQVEPKEEYRPTTHPAYVKVGEMTGWSPERMRYALEQFFTSGNIYTSATGFGLRQIMDKLPEDVKDTTTQDMLRQAPFLRRVLKATDPYTQYAKGVKEAKIEEATRQYKQTRTFDALSEQFYAGEIDDTAIREFISTQPWHDRERLMARFRRYERIRELPDKRWWLNLMDADPEVRAHIYWTRWSQADRAERRRLEKYLRQVPEIATERFFIQLNTLKAKE